MKSFLIFIAMLSLLAIMLCSCSKETPKRQDFGFVKDSLAEVYPSQIDTSAAGGFRLTEYDTPPSPVQNPLPAYPAKYLDSGIQGVVVLEVEVNTDGHVGKIKVMKSLIPGEGGLDEAAVKAVKTWLFKPALLNNQTVKSRVNIPVPFSLKT